MSWLEAVALIGMITIISLVFATLTILIWDCSRLVSGFFIALVAFLALIISGIYIYSYKVKLDTRRHEFIQVLNEQYVNGVELVPLQESGPTYITLVSGEMCNPSFGEVRTSNGSLEQCVLISYRRTDGSNDYLAVPLSRVRMAHQINIETPVEIGRAHV